MMKDQLSVQRILNLIKHDVWRKKKTILVTAITIIALLALFPFHVTGSSQVYFQLLYFGGFVITGLTFKELSDQKTAAFYLMIPASNLEKLLSKWLMTSIGYAVAILIVYTMFSILSVIVNQLVFSRTLSIFNPFSADLWVGIFKYMILQSVVFLGAITFKKNVLIKTTLIITGLIILFSMLVGIFVWIFCPDCMISSLTQLAYSSFEGAQFLFWVALAPFCWYLTYLKLSKAELC